MTPQEICYGIGANFSNKDWYNDGVWSHTFFKHSDDLYVVVFLNIESGAFYSYYSEEKSDNATDFNDTQHRLRNFLNTFSESLYVVLDSMERFHLRNTRLDGEDCELEITLQRIIKNKLFNDSLKDHKLNYMGIDEYNFYVFG